MRLETFFLDVFGSILRSYINRPKKQKRLKKNTNYLMKLISNWQYSELSHPAFTYLKPVEKPGLKCLKYVQS